MAMWLQLLYFYSLSAFFCVLVMGSRSLFPLCPVFSQDCSGWNHLLNSQVLLGPVPSLLSGIRNDAFYWGHVIRRRTLTQFPPPIPIAGYSARVSDLYVHSKRWSRTLPVKLKGKNAHCGTFNHPPHPISYLFNSFNYCPANCLFPVPLGGVNMGHLGFVQCGISPKHRSRINLFPLFGMAISIAIFCELYQESVKVHPKVPFLASFV